LVEQENLARIVSMTKIDHCPIVICPLPLVVWMCSVKMLIAGALQSIFRFAAEGVSVTRRNYVWPVTRHPPQNAWVNLNLLVQSFPIKLTLV
jgi:hypothetical protein